MSLRKLTDEELFTLRVQLVNERDALRERLLEARRESDRRGQLDAQAMRLAEMAPAAREKLLASGQVPREVVKRSKRFAGFRAGETSPRRRWPRRWR